MSDSLRTHPVPFTEAGISGRRIHRATFHVVTEDSSTVPGSAINLLQLTTEPTVPVRRLNPCPAPADHVQYTATGVDGANGHRRPPLAAMESSRGRGIATPRRQPTVETSARECHPNRRFPISHHARSTVSGRRGVNGPRAALPVAMLVRRSERGIARLLNHNMVDVAAKERVCRSNPAQRQAVELTADGLNGRPGPNAVSAVAMVDS